VDESRPFCGSRIGGFALWRLLPLIWEKIPFTLLLFAFYLAMHALWGILLGLVVTYGLRSATAARQG
jgi:ABC-type dipeptide/oligopeptide/nickel transport system permease component